MVKAKESKSQSSTVTDTPPQSDTPPGVSTKDLYMKKKWMEVETILVSVGKGVWWHSDSMAGMVMNIDLKITMSICEHSEYV